MEEIIEQRKLPRSSTAKRLLFFAFFVFLACAAKPVYSAAPCAAVSSPLLQCVAVNSSVAVNKLTATYGSANAAGNLLVALVNWGTSNGGTVLTMSDTVNGSWTKATDFNSAVAGLRLAVFYKANSAAGTPTVTVSSTIGAAWDQLYILEYSGVSTSSPLDGSNGAESSTANPSINVTDANSGDLVLGITASAAGPLATAGSGYTQIDDGSVGFDTTEYKVASGAGTVAVAFTAGVSSWAVAGASFSPASSNNPPGQPGAPYYSAVSTSTLTVNWTGASGSPTSHNIQRATSSNGVYSSIATTTPGSVVSYGDTGLATSTTYWYRVAGTNANGTGSYSATSSVTTGSGGGGGGAAISFNASSSSSGVSVNSLSWNHTCSGSNPVLIVGVSARFTGTPRSVTNITYNSVALTKAASSVADDGVNHHSEIWYLPAPSCGGALPISVTLGSTATGVVGGAVSLNGADQTSPLDAAAGANGGSTSPSVSVTTVADNSWVVDALEHYESVSETNTPGGSQTARWDINNPSGNNYGGGSTKGPVTPAGATSMSWTIPSHNWTLSAASFKPAPADTTPPTPNPMTFASTPTSTATSSITMTASTATDAATPPVSYLFSFLSCANDGGSGGASSGWQSGTSYTNTGLQTNQCYAYTVAARDSVSPTPNQGTASASSSVYTLASVPGAPTVNAATTSTLNLTNNSNGNPTTNPATLFAVQVTSTSPADANWSGFWVDSSGASSTTAVWLTNSQLTNLVVKNLKTSTSYTFTSKARNQNLTETAQGPTGSGTTTSGGGVPGVPGTPYYTAVSTSTLTVNWTGASGSPSSYNIQRSTSGNGPFTSVATTSPLSYQDMNLASSTTYWYRVAGTNASGTGAYSATSSVTTFSGLSSGAVSGYLDSATYDTGVTNGAQLNSFLWHGNRPAGTQVSFQFAVSNSSSGPWNSSNFMGTDGTANTYYTVTYDTSQPLDYSLFNNFRYFRYRVTLYSDSTQTLTPQVNAVIVNWSP